MATKKKAPKGVCWKGYTMVGHKMKNGKKVPNCVKTSDMKKKKKATKKKMGGMTKKKSTAKKMYGGKAKKRSYGGMSKRKKKK